MRMIRRAFGRAFCEDELEDIYGNAWLGTLRALERRQASLTDDEIRKYLFTAVAHQASKELRRRGRKPTAPLEAAGEVADVGQAPDEQAVSSDDRRLARDLLASLPARRRAVMMLRYGCGLEPAQVCALVSGLSPRAYRKEITRGVDELTEKLRMVERGEWCAEREPLMKAFAAGIATEDERRAARHHLSRCAECSELVGRLTGHLHDLGGLLTIPAALEAVGDGSIQDRAVDLFDRVRDALPGPFGRVDTEGASAVAASGAARGSGAAGAGALAKLAGVSVGGKLAAACLAGGVVATTCAATGILPAISVSDLGGAAKEVATTDRAAHVVVHHDGTPALARTSRVASTGFAAAAVAEPPPVAEDPPRDQSAADSDTTATVSQPASTTPIAPTTPPVQQQFGVPAAAPTGSSGRGSAGSGATSGGSPGQQEFGP